MLTRRKFIKNVTVGALATPFLGMPRFPEVFNTASQSRYIPGWSRHVACEWTEQVFPFTDFFKNDYLIRSHDYPFNTPFNVVQQSLYEPCKSVMKFTDKVHLLVISEHLDGIESVEHLFNHDDHINDADLSFGFFTLPKNIGGIKGALQNRSFIQLLDRLPCPVVLVDAQEVERTVPKLPLVNPSNSNRDRILQTAICSVLEPIVNVGMIGVDFADLRALQCHGKLFGVGIGFIDMSEDLDTAAVNSFNTICNQIGLGGNLSNVVNSCWGNVCGNHKISMDHLKSLADRLHAFDHEDAYLVTSLTLDNGLEVYVMETCVFGLV